MGDEGRGDGSAHLDNAEGEEVVRVDGDGSRALETDVDRDDGCRVVRRRALSL